MAMTHSNPYSQPGVTSFRRSIWFQPIAVMLAIILAPLAVWLDTNPIYASISPLAAQAQSVGGFCSALPSERRLIREFCVNNASYAVDLTIFEQQTMAAWLASHGMPATESDNFYKYANEEARSEFRAYMLGRIMQIASMPAANRSANENKVYEWMEALVRANELKQYQEAYSHFVSLMNDPCRFTLDKRLSKSMNITYNGAPYCNTGYNLNSLFDPTVYIPSPSYFYQYGVVKSYGAASDLYPGYNQAVSDTLATLGPIIGISVAAGSAIAIAAGTALATTILIGSLSTSAAYGAFIVTASTIAALSTALLVVAPVLIVVLAVIFGTVAAIMIVNNQNMINELSSLQSKINQAINNPLTLQGFINDRSGNGAFKVGSTFVAQTLTNPSLATDPLPTHRPNVDLGFLITPQSGSPFTTEAFSYKDWKGVTRTTTTWNGWLLDSCSVANSPCYSIVKYDSNDIEVSRENYTTSFNATIRYTDWNGVRWLASRFGDRFLNARADRGNLQDCVADATTGLSTANPSSCASYVSSSIPIVDSNGNRVTLAFTTFRAPVVTNTNWTFSQGTSATQTAVVSANPTARICLVNGALSSNFTYSTGCYEGSAISATFNGNLLEPTALSRLDYTVTNVVGTRTVSINVGVGIATKIISPGTVIVPYGQPVSITLAARGVPRPQLSIDPAIPLYGLTFTNNGNGTATLSGVATNSGLISICDTSGCPKLTATNGFTSDSQVFNVVVDAPPFAEAIGPFSTTFTNGVMNRFKLFSKGATTPVSWVTSSTLPSWLTLVNSPDGTATLQGIPPLGTTQPLELRLGPNAQGTATLTQAYTINFTDQPTFTSSVDPIFYVGVRSEFSAVATTGTITLDSGLLPDGLIEKSPAFAPPSGVARAIGGIPAAGTGGSYQVRWKVTSPAGSSFLTLPLLVYEAPRFVSAPLAMMFAGRPASFNVATTGYPSVSTVTTGLDEPPKDVSFGRGMFFSITGLPSSLTATNRNSSGFATGQLTISGTPTTADIGTRTLPLVADNAVGQPVASNLTLRILPYNPTQPVQITPGFVTQRNAAGNVVITVVLANGGSTAASNVAITSARLDGVAPTLITPPLQPSIPAADTATYTLTFPSTTAGTKAFTLTGTHAAGTFNINSRTIVP